jgi:transcriptional regulator with XRE-family HTH domain
MKFTSVHRNARILAFKSHSMDIKTKIGAALREIREKKNITQAVLATVSGIDRTFISHVENGGRNISIETLEKILKGLDVTFKEFFKRSDLN